MAHDDAPRPSAPVDEDLAPYAGHWVALAGDRVAGIGHTAAEASRLASRNRPRERFKLRFVEAPGGEPLPLPPLLERLRPLLERQETPVYLVGGALRDALLGRASHDLDFVVSEQAIRLAKLTADALGMPAYPLDQERDTGRVVLPAEQTTLDFARFRGADLETDLYNRDFTINAMALPAAARSSASVVDPQGGRADLAARVIRQVHSGSIANDPIRAVRAVRLAEQLGFDLEEATARAAEAAAPTLMVQVSPERVRDEMVRLLELPAPDVALRRLHSLGLLAAIWPEVAALEGVAQSAPHREPVYEHSLSVLRWLALLESAILEGRSPADPAVAQAVARLERYREPLQQQWRRPVTGGVDGRLLLRLAALLHDAGKATTQAIEPDGRIRFLGHDRAGAGLAARALKRLHFSNEAVAHVERAVAGHMRPLQLAGQESLSRRAAFRFFRDTELAGLDLGLITLADHLGTYGGRGPAEEWERLLGVVERLLGSYFDQYSEVVRPAPLLNGQELMAALSLRPGPEVGRLLRLIEEAQAAGEIASREEALELARRRPR